MGGSPNGGSIPGGPQGRGGPQGQGGPLPPAGQGAGSVRGGVELGPPGRWWDDKSYAKTLKLRPDQQSRMDAIFEQTRPTLVARYDEVQGQLESIKAKIASEQSDSSALDCDIGSCTHSNPNVGLRERGRIVDTIACHRNYMAFGLQLLYDFGLLVG